MAATDDSLKCATEAVVLPVTLEWAIRGLYTLCRAGIPPLRSSVYSYKGMKLQLQITASQQQGFQGTIYRVQFCLVSCPYSLPLQAQYFASIVKPNGKFKNSTKSWIAVEALNTFMGKENIPGDYQFFDQQAGDEVIVKYSIWFTLETRHTQHESTSQLEGVQREGDLKADLSSLLRDGPLSDVTLVAGEQTFPAHKAILSSRSPVFEKMFEHEMKESTTSRVGITDIEPPVLQELLLYIYTGELSSKDHKKLLYAADKYHMERLKVLCENKLSHSITVETVAESLVFAQLHRTDLLMKRCISFIVHNRSAVMKTPGWGQIAGHSELMTKLFEAV